MDFIRNLSPDVCVQSYGDECGFSRESSIDLWSEYELTICTGVFSVW